MGSEMCIRDRDYGLYGDSSNTHGSRRSSIRTVKMAPPVFKERKAFQAFLQRVKVYSKFYGFESVLQSEPHLDVGSTKRNVLINQGVSAETHERHLRAWVFFSQAFELPADVGRFQRSTSPGGFWEATLKRYLPQNRRLTDHFEKAVD